MNVINGIKAEMAKLERSPECLPCREQEDEVGLWPRKGVSQRFDQLRHRVIVEAHRNIGTISHRHTESNHFRGSQRIWHLGAFGQKHGSTEHAEQHRVRRGGQREWLAITVEPG